MDNHFGISIFIWVTPHPTPVREGGGHPHTPGLAAALRPHREQPHPGRRSVGDTPTPPVSEKGEAPENPPRAGARQRLAERVAVHPYRTSDLRLPTFRTSYFAPRTSYIALRSQVLVPRSSFPSSSTSVSALSATCGPTRTLRAAQSPACEVPASARVRSVPPRPSPNAATQRWWRRLGYSASPPARGCRAARPCGRAGAAPSRTARRCRAGWLCRR